MLMCFLPVSTALTEQQGSDSKDPQQVPDSRQILATIPERYCHVGIHTAGDQLQSVALHVSTHQH